MQSVASECLDVAEVSGKKLLFGNSKIFGGPFRICTSHKVETKYDVSELSLSAPRFRILHDFNRYIRYR